MPIKKRCTNSACRKTFDTAQKPVCPHCGKAYPRTAVRHSVTLLSTKSKLAAIRVIRAHAALSLREAKDLVDSAPVVLAGNLSKEDANQLAAQLTAADCVVRIRQGIPGWKTAAFPIMSPTLSPSGIMGQSIDVLDLSVRAYNCLRRADVQTLQDLTALTEEELGSIRNMGSRTVAEIKALLAGLGLSLAPAYQQTAVN